MVRSGLERKCLATIGVLLDEVLSSPTVEQIIQDIDAELLSGPLGLRNSVSRG